MTRFSKHLFKSNAFLRKGLELQLVENESCICHEGRLVTIPKPMQRSATIWYHHYLQHPGHTRLEETMKAAIYWKGMRITIRSITKSCKTCQVNKKRSLKYGHLPSKIVICIPWEALCVDLIGPYVGPQFGMNPEPVRGSPNWNFDGNQFGDL